MGTVRDALLDRLAASLARRQRVAAQTAVLAGLRHAGANVEIGLFPEVYAAECIELHDGVRIGHHVRLQGITWNAGRTYRPLIRIGAGTSLENHCTITANELVDIGRRVLIAGNVFISDHEHRYEDPDRAVADQGITHGGRVRIGDGCHIGQNVSIFGDVTLGEHVVVGAGAVVTRDLPAFSVAVGAPARVVRRYDAASGRWERA
jgi:acetyltransferase-like isoleucine patch superfamily enzyme